MAHEIWEVPFFSPCARQPENQEKAIKCSTKTFEKAAEKDRSSKGIWKNPKESEDQDESEKWKGPKTVPPRKRTIREITHGITRFQEIGCNLLKASLFKSLSALWLKTPHKLRDREQDGKRQGESIESTMLQIWGVMRCDDVPPFQLLLWHFHSLSMASPDNHLISDDVNGHWGSFFISLSPALTHTVPGGFHSLSLPLPMRGERNESTVIRCTASD